MTKKHTKVLHVFGRMDRGGAEMRTVDLLRQRSLDPFEFHFATLAPGRGSLDSTIEQLNGFVHSCPMSPTFPFRFRRLLRTLSCRVVHSHVHHSSGFILRAAALEGVPMRIAHFRSTGDGQPETARRRAQRSVMSHWIDRYATAIVAVGVGAMEGSWRSNWRTDERCSVIHNGLDLKPYAAPPERAAVRRDFGMPADSPLIIHVGSMFVFKNQERLVQIFAELFQRDPRRRLLLVGRDGDGTRSRVLERIGALNLTNAVSLAGERDDVARLLKAADLMIFPSSREGLPGAVLEACAAGIPVVATSLPGVLEIADECPAVTGLPLQEPDDVWVQTAERLLASRPAVVTLAGSRFDAAVAAHRFATLYGQQPEHLVHRRTA